MVYPNPASDKFTLYLSTDQEAKLINLAGATVWKEKLTAGRHIISITLLPKGIYMLQAGKTWHKLLVQ
ncbi:MAG: T9SS type A sorting domain-containing protein [Cyanobium sp.]